MERNWPRGQHNCWRVTALRSEGDGIVGFLQSNRDEEHGHAASRHEQQLASSCRLRKACAVLILGELRAQAEAQTLSAQERKEKTRITQRILRNDAQIRLLAEPWLATLEYMGTAPAGSALH